MDFPHGQTVLRDRRPLIPDPYNPDRPTPGNWSDATTATIDDAFIASSSSAAVPDPVRGQVSTAKSLYCQPSADITTGDRVRAGGVTYYVKVETSADVNPFTGWQPVREVPLDTVEG